jgi:hypothetical protein
MALLLIKYISVPANQETLSNLYTLQRDNQTYRQHRIQQEVVAEVHDDSVWGPRKLNRYVLPSIQTAIFIPELTQKADRDTEYVLDRQNRDCD